MPKTPAAPETRAAVRALQEIPGVGPSLARDLASLGIRSAPDPMGKSPEALYLSLERRMGTHVDRCVLYVFRCAVYYAEAKRPDPERLKWWNWKDRASRPAKRERFPSVRRG